MAFNLFFVFAALVAHQCSAVPVVLPTSLLPSLTLTGVPLPTGALMDTGAGFKKPGDLFLSLPTELPTTLSTFTGSLSLPSPTGTFPLPGSLTISDSPFFHLKNDPTATPFVPIATGTDLPTGLPTPPSLLPTGVPSGIPTGLPTGLPTPSALRAAPGGLLRPGRD
ncbi:unnamed protein product [Discula destructiva]